MRTVAFIGAVAIAFISTVGDAAAKDIVGTASVVDGDTLEIHGTRIRFHGIDAPESSQLCQRDGKPWRCGQAAALALADHIGRKTVACEPLKSDRYGRTVGRCTVGGEDVEGWMVINGWAVAYRQYSSDYVDQEEAAKKVKSGIWSSDFQMPWDWRRENKGGSQKAPTKVSATSKDTACAIKGNINSKGERIYHIPGGRWYDKTDINTSSGEQMFCSEAEALAAGWRKAQN